MNKVEPKSLLKIHSLCKSFTPDAAAVNEVSFEVKAGEIVCLLGPSGCGKTTLLRMIAGLERPDGGSVIFNGREMTTVPPHRRDFGMMFQDFALFPHKNVFQNVAFGLQTRGDAPEAVHARTMEMLALVGLQGFEERDVGLLSGGEQQRVALARSLAPGPRLLMLDEPLGALDRALRERLMLDLRGILKRVGVTAIYVTHDQTEAFAIADRIAVMNAGRIEQLDAPQRIFACPATPFAARFLGFHNLIEGTVTAAGEAATAIGRLPLPSPWPPAGEQVTILIKPDAAEITTGRRPPAAVAVAPFCSERVRDPRFGRREAAGSVNRLERIEDSAVSDQRSTVEIEGVITVISFRGKYYQVWIEVSEQSLMFELPSVSNWQAGDKVQLSLDIGGMAIIPFPEKGND